MSKLRFVAALLLAAGLCTLPAVAQQDAAKKTGPPKAAKGVAEVVLESWNGVGKKLIAMAEDFPEDKYDYKPTPAQRSFAEQLLHACGASYFFTNLAEGKPLP